MAKTGTIPPIVLDDLRAAYIEMQDKKTSISRAVRERYRARIEEEIAAETRVIERAFAVQFEEVRAQGATRKELVKVIGDGSADVFRKYVELGGGTIAGRKTVEELREERGAVAGVTRVDENLFNLSVGTEGATIRVSLEWEDTGRVHIWPANPDDVVVLRENYGYTTQDMYSKGEEIARVFGLEP